MINTFKKPAASFSKCLLTSAFAALSCSVVVAITPMTAVAQEAEAPSRQFGSKSGQVVLTAQEQMASDQWSAALSTLSQALAIPELNPYEKSIIYQMQGSSYYELNQYPTAIQSFENAISAGGLLPNESSALRLNIAQLLIASDQFARGAQMLEDWNRAGGQFKPQHIEMLWQAWSQANQYSRALPWAERWFNQANPKERKHFDTLNYMYNNLNMPAKQADIVKQMINRWPQDKTLWDAWASMLANGGREQEAFEVSKMLYLGGAYSSEQDLSRVVQYYSFYEMPYQAAQILEREMNAGRIQKTSEKLVQLSNLFRQAREYKRAIPILEQAAASSNQAKLYADLGEALYNEGQCEKAEGAFRKAMDRGFDQGKAWMLIANCRYDTASAAPRLDCEMTDAQIEASPRNKGWNHAIAAFDNVPASSRERSNATKWKSFIKNEKQGFLDRCQFKKDVVKEGCFQDIALAYDNVFLAGEFKLDDEKCEAFKAEYDSLYRINLGDTEDDG
ncbi:MAG: tetratricopeptide repeat protein [Hyphomonadaceae bacterium]|nr:tetratricopeptide repeat protein [Hyphomonadaceae bacterium]